VLNLKLIKLKFNKFIPSKKMNILSNFILIGEVTNSCVKSSKEV